MGTCLGTLTGTLSESTLEKLGRCQGEEEEDACSKDPVSCEGGVLGRSSFCGRPVDLYDFLHQMCTWASCVSLVYDSISTVILIIRPKRCFCSRDEDEEEEERTATEASEGSLRQHSRYVSCAMHRIGRTVLALSIERSGTLSACVFPTLRTLWIFPSLSPHRIDRIPFSFSLSSLQPNPFTVKARCQNLQQ